MENEPTNTDSIDSTFLQFKNGKRNLFQQKEAAIQINECVERYKELSKSTVIDFKQCLDQVSLDEYNEREETFEFSWLELLDTCNNEVQNIDEVWNLIIHMCNDHLDKYRIENSTFEDEANSVSFVGYYYRGISYYELKEDK